MYDDLQPETAATDAARYGRQKHHPLKTVPPEALLAARRALRNAQSSGDADDVDMIGPVADAILAAGLRVIFELDTTHLIKITDTGSWTVQHALSCRPNLFNCALAPAPNFADDTSWEAGVYEISLNSAGERVLGKRVS